MFRNGCACDVFVSLTLNCVWIHCDSCKTHSEWPSWLLYICRTHQLFVFSQACILHAAGHSAFHVIYCMESSADVLKSAKSVSGFPKPKRVRSHHRSVFLVFYEPFGHFVFLTVFATMCPFREMVDNRVVCRGRSWL